jgi:hypothetical protein
MSNFSVKSDSGINLPVPGKQPSLQQQQELQQQQQQQPQQQQSAVSKKSETRRNILVLNFILCIFEKKNFNLNMFKSKVS